MHVWLKMEKNIIAAAVLLLAGILSGCQPTPEKEPVVNRNDGRLEAIVAASPVPQKEHTTEGEKKTTTATQNATLRAFINAEWEGSFTYGDLTIEVNTMFEVGDGSACAVREAAKKRIDPNWVNAFIEPFIADAVEMTGVEITLEEAEGYLESAMRGSLVEVDGKSWYEPYEGQEDDIAYWAKKCQEIREKGSPEWVKVVSVAKMPHNCYYRTDTGFMYRVGATERYASISFNMDRLAVVQNESAVAKGEMIENEPPGTTITAEGTSQKEAEALALEAIKKIGLDNLQISSVQRARAIKGNRILFTGWIIFFELGGEAYLPAEYSTLPELPSLHTEEEESYSIPWGLEYAYVFVDGKGNLRKIYVQDPVEFGGILNENVALLGKDEMQERIVKQLHMLCASNGGKVRIERVLLSGLLIQRPNSNTVWQVPSWVVHFTYDDGVAFNNETFLLAMNAIDGSVIHLKPTM